MDKKLFKTRDVLLVAAYLTQKDGYHPVSEGKDSTKEHVLEYLNSSSSVDELTVYQKRAENAVQWVKGEKSSDWIDNIKSCLTKKEVGDIAVGIISSLYSGFDKHERLESNKALLLKSEFQGKPKEEITFEFKSFKHISSGKSKFNENKDFHIMQIIDKNNNVYIWFGDTDCTKDFEHCQKVYARVKSHNERDGVKQTIIQVLEIL